MSSEPPHEHETQPEETTPNQLQQSISASGGSTISNVSQTINIVSQSETEELEKYLDGAVRDFEFRMTRLLLEKLQPDSPFKSLEYFRIEDSSIFFGRQTATQELFDKVVANRLMILNAPSGAGKSSILNAGLSPLLLREARLPVYVRIHPYQENLVREIKQAIFPPSRKPWPGLLDRLSLHEFLGLLTMKRSDSTREMVIILDQFEQFLISLRKKEIRQSFIEILRDCYEDETLPVRFIISLKRENLGDLLDLFEHYIPGILQNRYYLLPMNEDEVKEAITGPIRQIDPDVSVESALLDQLVQELGKNVELTYLQIVCSQLYNRLPDGQQVITTRLYEEQGKMKDILSTYLDKTLEPLPEYKHKIARTILVELVGADGTHPVLRLPDFEQVVDPDPSVIEEVLEYLVNNRLLRRDMDPEERRYELAHEYLAEEIFQMVDEKQWATKKAQDMLQEELANSRQFYSKIDPKQLNYLKEHLRLRSLDDAARQLLFESSLVHAHDVDFWLYQMRDKHQAARNAATAALENHQIAEFLKAGTAEDLRPDVLAVLWEAYHGKDRLKRQQAVETLSILEGWLSPQEKSRIKWGLRRIQVRQSVQHNARPLLVTAFFGIPLVIWLFFFVERPLPGQWVDVRGGSFIMGMDEKEAQFSHQSCLAGVIDKEECKQSTQELLLGWSGRQKNAALESYSMLDNEVTFAQYEQCVAAGECDELVDVPAESRGPNLPATHLNWFQAEAYCEWLDGRLPTEAEWEKAARGPKGNYFPWGNNWDETMANIEHTGEGSVTKISQFAETDKSYYDIKNLAGNVREWTSSECSLTDCAKPEGQKFSDPVMTAEQARTEPNELPKAVIVRGGFWGSARSQGIASERAFVLADQQTEDLGFRCVCPPDQTCKTPWTRWWIWLRLD